MADITPAIPGDRQVIDSYGPGRFKIARVDYAGPVIVLPERVLAWDVATLDALAPDRLEPAVAADPPIDLLLIGTGKTMRLVPKSLRETLRARGVAVDFMDTGAACRTYNVLLADGRRVGAALIPV